MREIPKKYPRNTQEKLPETSRRILDIIAKEPSLTRLQIAEKLEISADTVKVHLALLKKTGHLERVGATKNGRWVVINNKS